MNRDIRIAAVSCRSVVGRTWDNLERIRDWTCDAEKLGADMVCFPELCITGYHVREPIESVAESLEGQSIQEVKSIARQHNVIIIAGLAERENDGRIYATQVVADRGRLIGTYRKVHLGPPEKDIFTAAEAIPPIFRVEGFSFGIQLCYDAHFPEMATHMALQGADAILMPHASPGAASEEKHRSWMRHLPARAYDNGLFVLAVNPADDNGHGLKFPATAIALSPSGQILDSHAANEETMTIVNFRREMLDSVRNSRMGYFFPHRRPELYHID